ncbi:cyclic-phosphate processing receiver domain-containing protein [Fuerstiella marisgermanici]|uniref:Cyclic-phosphate processing Receiver domain-containing protein n=1 Tax=Fuerstiella marisgermanici TaxID=1891926 RepID=A0A1P8WPG3_9PLAN|nr:cyclic-phosphate processing receiver domain-containing protein [Fuerstiella marisgermanici]APZ95957.1 hypothetical protein Fuma_05620 [Fuerstiella marisgermanici]
MRILILEDNAERRTAMIEHLADRLPMFAIQFCDTAESMCKVVQQTGLDDVALISLDNDLEPVEFRDGKPIDPGSGVDVAACLVRYSKNDGSSFAAAVPVIVHSTNEPASVEIIEMLKGVGFQISRIVPYDAEKWIGEIWVREVRRLIVGNVTEMRGASVSP